MNKPTGKMLEYIRAIKTLDYMPIVDFHTHLAHSSHLYYLPENSTKETIDYMDNIGVNHMITFTLAVTSDVETGNNYIYDQVKEYPDRISSLTMLHAGFPQDWLQMLQNGKEKESKGIKLISTYQVDKPEVEVDFSPAFDYAKDKNWVVLNHDWGTTERLEWYAKNFPNVTFIVGHGWQKHDGVYEKYDNVYLCTCASFVSRYFGTVEEHYKNNPVEKILFGSDSLDLDFCTALGELAYSDIPEQAKEKIAGGNAIALMKKLGWKIKI